MKAVEKGQVSFAHLEQAVITLTAAGTKWGGLTAQQSETVLGKWSTFQDSVTASLRDVGESFLSTGLAQEAMSQGQRFVTAAFALGKGFIDAYGGTALRVAQTCLNLTGVLVNLAEAVLGIDNSATKANEATKQQEIRAEAASAAMREQAKATKELTDAQDQYATKAEKLGKTLEKIAQLDAAGDTIANLSRRAMLQETGLGSELDRLQTEIDILEGRTTAIQAKAAEFAKNGADAGHVRRFTEMAEQAEALKEARKAAEERQRVFEKAEEQSRKLGEELKQKEKDRAKEIFESTRNPVEQLRAGLRELTTLRDKGLIDPDTFNRQAKQLGEDFRNAMPKPQEWRPNVAIEAKSSEAISIAVAAMNSRPTKSEDLLDKILQASGVTASEIESLHTTVQNRLQPPPQVGRAFRR
jgi:DNA repair exonuclease SbcCD ATPase subunit